MNPSFDFNRKCNKFVAEIQNHIVKKWDYFVETDIYNPSVRVSPVCEELKKYLENNIFNAIIKDKISKDDPKPISVPRTYVVNVTSKQIDSNTFIIMYSIRYNQSLTDTKWATLRGSGGWLIVDNNMKILANDTMIIYHKIGQDFDDIVNAMSPANGSSDDEIAARDIKNTLKYLCMQDWVVKEDGSHVRIHTINYNSDKFILISTQMLEYNVLVKYDKTINIDSNIKNIIKQFKTMQKTNGDIKCMYISLYYYLSQQSRDQFENNVFQLENLTPEHPGWNSDTGNYMMPHNDNVIQSIIHLDINSLTNVDKDILFAEQKFLRDHRPRNFKLETIIANEQNQWINNYFNVKTTPLMYTGMTYGQLIKDITITMLVMLTSYTNANKTDILSSLDNANILKLLTSASLDELVTRLIVLLDIMLMYVGHGDIPEGLLLGIELKTKLQLWKLAHGSSMSPLALMKPDKTTIGRMNIPTLKSCALHLYNMIQFSQSWFGHDIEEKIQKSLTSLGLFGEVMRSHMDMFGQIDIRQNILNKSNNDEHIKKCRESYDVMGDIVNKIVIHVNGYARTLDKLNTSDIVFDYDGTIDNLEVFEIVEQLVLNNLDITVFTGRDSISLRDHLINALSLRDGDNNVYTVDTFLSKSTLFSIADLFIDNHQLFPSMYKPQLVAVIKSIIFPKNDYLKLVDDSTSVNSMFKYRDTHDKLYNSVRVVPDIDMLRKSSKKITKQPAASTTTNVGDIDEDDSKISSVVIPITNTTCYGSLVCQICISLLKKLLNDSDIDSAAIKIKGLLNFMNNVTKEWFKFDLGNENVSISRITDTNKSKLDKFFGDGTSFNVGLVYGFPGSGKSTMINSYTLLRDNVYVFAKDIGHMCKSYVNNNPATLKYKYNFVPQYADLANELSKLCAFNARKLKNFSSLNGHILILDGANFSFIDAHELQSTVHKMEVDCRTYTLKEYVNLIFNIDRRRIIDIYKYVPIAEFNGNTLYTKAMKDPNISIADKQAFATLYKDYSLNFTALTVGKNDLEAALDTVNIDASTFNIINEVIDGNKVDNVQNIDMIKQIVKNKNEFHAFTHYQSSTSPAGYATILLALSMLGFFNDCHMRINEIVYIVKNKKIGACYLNCTIISDMISKYLEPTNALKNDGHITLVANFVGGAGVIHSIKQKVGLTHITVPLDREILLPIKLMWKFSGKQKVQTELNTLPPDVSGYDTHKKVMKLDAPNTIYTPGFNDPVSINFRGVNIPDDIEFNRVVADLKNTKRSNNEDKEVDDIAKDKLYAEAYESWKFGGGRDRLLKKYNKYLHNLDQTSIKK